jgi:hypothetical protein
LLLNRHELPGLPTFRGPLTHLLPRLSAIYVEVLQAFGNHPRRRPDFYFERAGGQGGVVTAGADED